MSAVVLTFRLALLGSQDHGADDDQQQRNCGFHDTCKERSGDKGMSTPVGVQSLESGIDNAKEYFPGATPHTN